MRFKFGRLFFIFCAALILTNSTLSRADIPMDEGGPEELTFDPHQLIQSVVKITNRSADIFSAIPEESHGTGFFIGLNPSNGLGLIFTNRHVIENESTSVQRLTIEFNTEQKRGESIQGKLIYQSQLHDFAVLEFDPSQLKRAKISPASALALPDPSSPFYDFEANERQLRGRDVMAIGNPFEGSNVTTYGQITGLHFDSSMGPFIQTQAPINPGNSGGPLISLDTGEVIGINTMTVTGADGTHYSIPIGILLDEFLTWQNQRHQRVYPTIAAPRLVRLQANEINHDQLNLMGLTPLIEAAIPGYFHNFESALMVSDSHPDSSLERGDVLLKIDGQILGGIPYNLSRQVQVAGPQATIQVLRHRQVLDVSTPIKYDQFQAMRSEVDFVYISGLLLQEYGENEIWNMNPLFKTRVMIQAQVSSAETNFRGEWFPRHGSLVAGVSFGDKDYPIRTLLDLKKAINANRDKKFITLHVYRAHFIGVGDQLIAAKNPATDLPIVDNILSTYVIPMREILTPMQFSITQFKRQFVFGSDGSHTWNWNDQKRKDRIPSGCQTQLQNRD